MKQGSMYLVEKPFALNAADAQSIVKAAKKKGVHVAEAFVWRHMKAHSAAKSMIQSGQIGEPGSFKNGEAALYMILDVI